MKKIIAFFLFIVISGICVFLFENNPTRILGRLNAAKDNNLNAHNFKKLRYRIFFLGLLPVGEAVLGEKEQEEYRGKTLYHLRARAQSKGVIAKIYPFEAAIDSFLEPDTLLPLVFTQDIQTKDKKLTKEVSYDQLNHIMEIAGERRSILPQTYEPLSAMLRLRTMELDKIKEFDLNINTNQKNYSFSGNITFETLKIKNTGDSLVYRLKGKIFRRDKNPYHRSQTEIVLYNDKARIPIFIKVFASGALITVRLTDIE